MQLSAVNQLFAVVLITASLLTGTTLQDVRWADSVPDSRDQHNSRRTKTNDVADIQRTTGQGNSEGNSVTSQNTGLPLPSRKPVRRAKSVGRTPNIILIVTDDQDVELGSLNYMPKAARTLRDQGATFVNAFVTTPMCCPSRSSLLTGMYVHNHNVYTNNDNCSSEQWRQTHETVNFGTYLSNAGYRTGFFGKYLNEYTGAYIPPGWTEWLGLIRNTRYYNYTLNHNGQKVKHEDNYYKDYLTDVIANSSVHFLRESKRLFPNRAVAMVLSMPAPHGPEDAAPQYQNQFMKVTSHRTQSWNFAPNPDKQWILQYTGKMTPIQIAFTDLLHSKRLQTLQSVDDAVEKVVTALEDLDELSNTYIIYTSDHGYHLGQYGLVKGKAMPYEFDIRVPFYMRGPKIKPGSSVHGITLNLDIAPTLLDIAGVAVPDHMDGASVMKLLDTDSQGSRKRKAWRDTFLVERGKLTQRKLKVQEKLEARFNKLAMTKEQRLEDECQKPEYQPPCRPLQLWECRHNEQGKLRIYRCRADNGTAAAAGESTRNQVRCACKNDRPMDAEEKQRQLDFLHHHVNQPARMVQPRFISGRTRRNVHNHKRKHVTAAPSTPLSLTTTADVTDSESLTTVSVNVDDVTVEVSHHHHHEDESSSSNGYETDDDNFDSDNDDDDVNSPENTELIRPVTTDWLSVNFGGHDRVQMPCRLTSNQSAVICERYVYTDQSEWTKQMSKIDEIINNYQHRISILQTIQKHLHQQSQFDSIGLSAETTTMSTNVGITGNSSLLDVERSLTHIDGIEADVAESTADGQLKTDQIETNTCTCDEDDTVDVDGLLQQRQEMTASKLETLARDIASQEEREELRKLKMEQHRLTKANNVGASRRRIAKNDKHHGKHHQYAADCRRNGSCSHNAIANSPTISSPYADFESIGTPHYSARHHPMCHIEGLECSRMDNDHWKVPPYWTHGPFCICPNSNNNTYWCLRTVNDTHNFLYCEFITGFISFYDMTRDPYQLRNAVHDLSFAVLHQLHDTLEMMKGCKGSRKCNHHAKIHNGDSDEPRDSWRQSRQFS